MADSRSQAGRRRSSPQRRRTAARSGSPPHSSRARYSSAPSPSPDSTMSRAAWADMDNISLGSSSADTVPTFFLCRFDGSDFYSTRKRGKNQPPGGGVLLRRQGRAQPPPVKRVPPPRPDRPQTAKGAAAGISGYSFSYRCSSLPLGYVRQMDGPLAALWTDGHFGPPDAPMASAAGTCFFGLSIPRSPQPLPPDWPNFQHQ